MFLGIDAGTEAIKAGVFDANGTRLASGTRPYPTHFPRPGHAEQDPADWWTGLVGAVRDCLESASVSPGAIQGIGFDATTCTLLPLSADGQPLRRALLWMDVRAGEQATRIFETGHPALRYSLVGVSAEWMPPKALWLKEHEPQIYDEAAYLIEFTDWIAYRLTGRLALNINTTTQRWFYDVSRGGWPSDFFEQIGLGSIERKFPPDILRLSEIVGKLSHLAADELGLPAGIPVAMGGGDAFVALLGLGVVNPGDLGVVMGSSNVLVGLSEREFHRPGILGTFPDAALPGLQLVEGGQVSTGSILNWFKQNFAGELDSLAAQQDMSIYQLLDREAAQVPVGSDGLIVLDYFQGNRTPHTDSYARGAVIGLSLQSNRAHVFRALMEGVAYGMRDILETFEANDFAVTRLISCGGATKSPVFMQIYADVTGKPLYVAREQEASLLGSAVLAAVGSGAFDSLEDASGAMTAVANVYEPDSARHQTYQFYFEKYRQMYQQLRGMMSEITRKQTL
jgi:ribulokinase